MTEFEIHEYRDYERFTQDWEDDEVPTQQVWQLLGQLEDDELLIQLPEWLAEQKVGFADGAGPRSSSVESIVKPTMPFYSVMQRPLLPF